MVGVRPLVLWFSGNLHSDPGIFHYGPDPFPYF